MSNGEDWLNRIESALDELRQRQEQTQAQIDAQLPVTAELRASVEVLRNAVDSQRAEITELRITAQALLQVAQIYQQNFERIVAEFNRHRSDGHGA
jgi:predicted  nucleic acid-binding Zn-ribbon protein